MKLSRWICTVALFLLPYSTFALDTAFDPNHSQWTAILKTYVLKEAINYEKLKAEGTNELNRYLEQLQKVHKSTYAQWTASQKIAYWINAYNAYTVKIIVQHFPIESIQKIGKKEGAAFKEQFIPISLLGKPKLSLDDIEIHLRKNFNEPRIHFALVCGAASCPVLHPEAFVATRLHEQLEQAAREFINDPHRNRYDAKTRTLKLSNIFNWYREDFEKNGETLIAFLTKYLPPDVTKDIQAGDVKIEFEEYSWCLSGRCPLPIIK